MKILRIEKHPIRRFQSAKIAILFFLCMTVFFIPQSAHAIPPPEFIFNFLSQIFQVISIAILFLSSGAGIAFQFFKTKFHSLKNKKLLVGAIVSISLVMSVGASYYLAKKDHDAEFERWKVSQATKRAAQKDSLVNANEELPDSIKQGRAKKGHVADSFKLNSLSKTQTSNIFFETNKGISEIIKNQELKDLLKTRSNNFFILDVRENIEFDLGRIPSANHIRMADLLNGDWSTLPPDKFIIIACYTALRGSEVADFLRNHGLVARFIEGGIEKWIEDGGDWTGESKLQNVYHEPQHRKRFTTPEFQKIVNEGALVVDSRPADVFASSHLANSLSLPILFAPKEQLDSQKKKIPAKSRIVVVCEDHWSCFSGFLAGIELEKMGHQFLGRYEKIKELSK